MDTTFQRKKPEETPQPTADAWELRPILNDPDCWRCMKKAYQRMKRRLEERAAKGGF